MTTEIPPSLQRFADDLHRAAVRELPAAPREVARPWTRRARPRLLAGGSLGLAGIAAALVITLSAGGATAPPAFAITRGSDGSVLVKFNFAGFEKNYGQAVATIRSEYDETFLVNTAAGPATVKGAIDCVPVTTGPDVGAKTPVKVLLGTDGTGRVPVKADGTPVYVGNTGPGGVSSNPSGTDLRHITSCALYNDGVPSVSGNSGNSGQ